MSKDNDFMRIPHFLMLSITQDDGSSIRCKQIFTNQMISSLLYTAVRIVYKPIEKDLNKCQKQKLMTYKIMYFA